MAEKKISYADLKKSRENSLLSAFSPLAGKAESREHANTINTEFKYINPHTVHLLY